MCAAFCSVYIAGIVLRDERFRGTAFCVMKLLLQIILFYTSGCCTPNFISTFFNSIHKTVLMYVLLRNNTEATRTFLYLFYVCGIPGMQQYVYVLLLL